MVARLFRIGWAREEAMREIEDPIFAMIEETKNVDFTRDPSELDSAGADEPKDSVDADATDEADHG
jgi:hypothetical protein